MRRRASITAAVLLIASLFGLAALKQADAASAATTRIWAVGDLAQCPNGEPAITAARDVVAGGSDPILALGDLAYPNGSTYDFNNCFGPAWGGAVDLRPRMEPVAGNHEYNTPNAAGYQGYFGSVPQWYSWIDNDSGWQILAIDSNCGLIGGCGVGSPVYTWLEAQLRDDPRPCQLAYWHHPRWSRAAHGPSTAVGPLYQLLVNYGVELLLTGHEHDYQRFAALDAAGNPSTGGVVQIIAGTGGASHNTGTTASGPMPEARNDTAYGALSAQLSASGWSTQFVSEAAVQFNDTASGACHAGPASTPPTTGGTGPSTTLGQGGPTTTAAPATDTQEPNSSVATPVLNSTITSPVNITGTATDDVGVSNVRVGIRNTTTSLWLQADGTTWGSTLKQFDATLGSPGTTPTTWSINRQLPAGNFAITVKAVDLGGRNETSTPWVPFKVSATGPATTTTTTTAPPSGPTTTAASSGGTADDIWAFWGYLYSDGKKQSNGTWRWDQAPHRLTASESRFQRGAAALGIGVVKESTGAWITTGVTGVIASLQDPRNAPDPTRAVQAYLSATIEDEAVCSGMVYDNISATVIQYVGDLYRYLKLTPTVKTYSGGFMELMLPSTQWPSIQSWPWATKARTPGAGPECTITVK